MHPSWFSPCWSNPLSTIRSSTFHPSASRKNSILDRMDMSSESSAARWYEPPRSTLEPPSGGAGVAGVVGNPTDYRGYYPHAGPTAHHPAAAAHYAHSKCNHFVIFVSSVSQVRFVTALRIFNANSHFPRCNEASLPKRVFTENDVLSDCLSFANLSFTTRSQACEMSRSLSQENKIDRT